MITANNKKYYPEDIASIVLSKLKNYAEMFLSTEVNDVVITVPAYFNDNQRNCTKAAGTLAGLNVVRIINEPTAAAIAYGFGIDSNKESQVLVYDLGGGTLDVSQLMIKKNLYEVKATSGNTYQGGNDFDNRLLEYCLNEFKKENDIDLLGLQNDKNEKIQLSVKKAVKKMLIECEKAKKTLSVENNTTIEIDSFYNNIDFSINITKQFFEEQCSDLFELCLLPINEILELSKTNKDKIDDIILVGGATRMKKIQNIIENYFNKKPYTSINPDEAIAQGAAIHAYYLSKSPEEKNEKTLNL